MESGFFEFFFFGVVFLIREEVFWDFGVVFVFDRLIVFIFCGISFLLLGRLSKVVEDWILEGFILFDRFFLGVFSLGVRVWWEDRFLECLLGCRKFFFFLGGFGDFWLVDRWLVFLVNFGSVEFRSKELLRFGVLKLN